VTQPRGSGFRLTPIPRYTTTTPRGTQVSCGGSCLPVPLGRLATVLGVAVPALLALARRRATGQP
jgi:hypothetical protein